ncbi:MAG: M48 family metalloprotease [Chthonomonas sp.]|nr:M48 family metalloprotease [Chthonomonas sp.]
MIKRWTVLALLAWCSVSASAHGDGPSRLQAKIDRAWAAFAQDPTASAPAAAAAPTLTDAQDERHARELKDDVALGSGYAKEVEKELKISTRTEEIERVQAIGRTMADIANKTLVNVSWGDRRLNPFNYTFKVVEGKDVNAFSLPGGFIYIYEGLLDYAESDDELAGVIAHEIAHASLRHIATLRRESSKLDIVTIPLILVGILTGSVEAVGGAQLLQQATGSGWSVKAEQAADYAGLQYIQQSNFNPVGMLTFMERLAFDDRYRAHWDLGIYRTHPPSMERAQSLRERLVTAKIPIRRSEVTKTLSTTVHPQPDGSVSITFLKQSLFTFRGDNAAERAQQAKERLDAFFDDLPKVHEVRLYGIDSIEGKGENLFQVTEEDAVGTDHTVKQLTRDAAEAVKRAAYELGYRVWEFPVR